MRSMAVRPTPPVVRSRGVRIHDDDSRRHVYVHRDVRLRGEARRGAIPTGRTASRKTLPTGTAQPVRPGVFPPHPVPVAVRAPSSPVASPLGLGRRRLAEVTQARVRIRAGMVVFSLTRPCQIIGNEHCCGWSDWDIFIFVEESYDEMKYRRAFFWEIDSLGFRLSEFAT